MQRGSAGLLAAALTCTTLLVLAALRAAILPPSVPTTTLDARSTAALRLLLRPTVREGLMWPLPGRACEDWVVSTDLGPDPDQKPDGIDIVPVQTRAGLPARALYAGQVLATDGGHVRIAHANGAVAEYGPLDAIAVVAHEWVGRGQELGEAGDHLTLSLHDEAGEALDPLSPAWHWLGPSPAAMCEPGIPYAAVVTGRVRPRPREVPPHQTEVEAGEDVRVVVGLVGDHQPGEWVRIEVFDAAHERVKAHHTRIQRLAHHPGPLYRQVRLAPIDEPGHYTVEVSVDRFLEQVLELEVVEPVDTASWATP